MTSPANLEIDYGGFWTEGDKGEGNEGERHRAAYVPSTGKLYIANARTGEEEILAFLEEENVTAVELLLTGWGRMCGTPGSLEWIKRRARLSGGNHPMKVFRDIEDYYDRDPARRASGEADYGCHWILDPGLNRWRVSYVQATGEIYAVPSHGGGPLLILGTIPPDRLEFRQDVYYRTLDRALAGWSDYNNQAGGLEWVRMRLWASGQ